MITKGIIFDLDGTLVDTLDDLTDSMNAALVQVGRPARPRQECMGMIGHGLRKFAERAVGPDHLELTDALIERMAAHYIDHCVLKTTPYPGMEEVITTLSKKGLRLGVLTNKNQAPSEIIVRHFFGCAFDPIVGAADGRETKPDPQTTLDILAGWGLDADEVIFIGDSETDIQTATNAGIRCVACEWGFRSKEQLVEAGGEILIREPGQILEFIG